MGGFILRTSDHGNFPINAAQVYYLVMQGHIPCPTTSRKQILDKNKAARVIRFLTLCQTMWFLVNCIARQIEGIALTTIELSTLAFILSAAGSFFCWFHKPMDVETPEYVDLAISIAEVKMRAGISNDNDWLYTPLDFVEERKHWPWTLYWHYGLEIFLKVFKLPRWLVSVPTDRPIRRIRDDLFPEPTYRSLPALFVFHVGYAGILMAGWNLDTPTEIELLLWRIASSIQLGTILVGWATMPLMMEETPAFLRRLSSFTEKPTKIKKHKPSHLRKWYSRDSISEAIESRAEKARTLINDHPHWRASIRLMVVYQATWVIYLTARLYIIVEDLVSLRALPKSAFQTVTWWPFSHI
jgi:hypothetical protein